MGIGVINAHIHEACKQVTRMLCPDFQIPRNLQETKQSQVNMDGLFKLGMSELGFFVESRQLADRQASQPAGTNSPYWECGPEQNIIGFL